MENKRTVKFRYLFCIIAMLFMLVAATGTFAPQIVNATSATTYTRTTNADGVVVQCQNGYLPETIYDRIGLIAPQDMVIDTVYENGEKVEYGYILDQGDKMPFILKFNLDNVTETVEKIEIGKREKEMKR